LICKNCKTEIPDEATFCSECGEAVDKLPVPPAEQQLATEDVSSTEPIDKQSIPLNVQPIYSSNVKPVGKYRFWFKVSKPSTKIMAISVWILSLICVALMVFSYFTTIDTAIDEVPVVNYTLKLTGLDEDYDNIMKDLKISYKDFISYNSAADDDSPSYPYSKITQPMKEMLEEPSLNNIKAAARSFKKIRINENLLPESVAISHDYVDDMYSYADSVISVSQYIIIGFMVVAALFVTLAAILRKNGLAIRAIIFCVIYSLLFSTLLWTILILLTCVTAVVLLFLNNSSYKKYMRTFV